MINYFGIHSKQKVYLSRLLQFIAFITILSLEKITGPQDYFEILLSASLKRLRNTALDLCFATFSNLRHNLKNFLNYQNTWTRCKEPNFECFPLPEVSFGCL